MTAYIIRRLWQMVPTLLGVVLLVFFLFNWVGGDPAYVLAGKISNPEQIDEHPPASSASTSRTGVQLWIFVQADRHRRLRREAGHQRDGVAHLRDAARADAHGDGPDPDAGHACSRSCLALAVAYVRGSLTDRAIMIACTVALSISFLVYIIVGQYAVRLPARLVPGAGLERRVLEQPGRPTRRCRCCSALMVEHRAEAAAVPHLLPRRDRPGLRAHRARQGLDARRRMMFEHVLRNAMIPILTNVAISLPGAALGLVPDRGFFSIPGLGREVILAVKRSDFPVIQAITVYLAVLTMLINLLTDLLYKCGRSARALK